MTELHTSHEQLNQQLAQVKNLLTMLEQENEVLQKNSPDALNEITKQKNDLLLAIQSLDDTIGKSATFAQEKTAGLHEQVLAEIEQNLEACKKQNLINGQIIQHSQLAVERMKTSLLDRHNKGAVTYDSKGKKSGGLSSIGIKA